ncbi:MAG: autoinducer synthesis protein [Gammaproteobacteria bacterium]|nr:autoinducer synthesis protein [Gammaproteobacteria bacterium]
MINISIHLKNDGQNNQLQEMFRLRNTVFKERLGWDVQSKDGLEIDGFDDLNPVYMMATNSSKQLEASWRMLPTDGPYMLANVFPFLLRGEEIPRSPGIWEISRWAAVSCPSNRRAQAYANESTISLIKYAYDYAVEHNISHYIVVTSVSMEKLVHRIGLPVRRFGDGKATRIGNVLSVACWVDINEQFHNVVYPRKAA